MATALAYHRPSRLTDALALLNRSGVHSRALGGGTLLNTPLLEGSYEAVDLQAVGLAGISSAGGSRLRIGAATTLQDLADDERVHGMVRRMAQRELPSTLRTLATVGGTIAAAEPESELIAALLVFDTAVVIADTHGERTAPLPQLLANPASLAGAIITSISLDTDGTSADDRTGRTPGDQPIVAAFARRAADGRVRIALSGVADTPILINHTAGLRPPGDFRGSTEYRRHLAAVLVARVQAKVEAA